MGTKKANAFGLFDTLGNVFEWCQDTYKDSYKLAPRDGSAREEAPDAGRVVRGGSWSTGPEACSSGGREFRGEPGVTVGFLGFRPVLSLGR